MPRLVVTLLLLLLVLTACGAPATGPAPVVESVTPSHGLGGDYRPLAPAEHFAPEETFYCAVLMRGLQQGVVVSARWLYEGTLIKRTDYVVQQIGNGYVGFELANDKPPWPAGEYSIEILVDHVRGGSAGFSVP